MSPTRYNSGHYTSSFSSHLKPRASASIATSFKTAVILIFLVSISLAFYSTRSTILCLPDPTPPSCSILSLSSPTNISHIVFGIGGSTSTWGARGDYADLWWKPNLTRGFVFLETKPDYVKTKPFKILHRLSSDWTGFRRTGGSESAVRLARVVVDLFSSGLNDVRWFVMGDDDTIFFPENLVTVLSKYDHRKMMYVGGNSESVEQNALHAYGMAFGGGGFAVSYPLAARLSRRMNGCLNRYHYFYGADQRVWACIEELGVSLTRESGFHQIDIRGDAFGLLAAHPVAPLVSLHHLDHVKPLFPNRTQLDSLRILMKAYNADPLRTLQHCFCYHSVNKWSISVSWGYVVQIYPYVMPAHELESPLQTFQTWRTWKDGPFMFNTRPVSRDPCRQPVLFYFDSVVVGNESSTAYRKFVERRGCHGNVGRVKEIVVCAPKMDADQNPRRQRCEIDGVVSEEGMLRIRITRSV